MKRDWLGFSWIKYRVGVLVLCLILGAVAFGVGGTAQLGTAAIGTTGEAGEFTVMFLGLRAAVSGRLLNPEGRPLAHQSFVLIPVPKDAASPEDIKGFIFQVPGYLETTVTRFSIFSFLGLLTIFLLGDVQLALIPPEPTPPTPTPTPTPTPGPFISSITPSSAGPGAKIKISGSGFSVEGVITFTPDVIAEEIISYTDTEIVLRVPRRAQTGPVTVTVKGVRSNEVAFSLREGFSTPPDPAAIVTNSPSGVIFPIDMLIIFLKDFEGLDAAEEIARKFGGSIAGYFPASNGYLIKFAPAPESEEKLNQIQSQIEADPRVELTVPNIALIVDTTDILRHYRTSRSEVWAYDRIQAQGAWNLIEEVGPPLHSVNIAVIDSGLDNTHHSEFAGVDTTGSMDHTGSPFGIRDEGGHGTQVTGIIAAINDGAGMNGVLSGILGVGRYTIQVHKISTAVIIPPGVMDVQIVAYLGQLINAIGQADGNGARIINISSGLNMARLVIREDLVGRDLNGDGDFLDRFGPSAQRILELRRGLRREVTNRPNTLFVLSAGNDRAQAGFSAWGGLADLPNVIIVGAIDRRDERAWFSNFGTEDVNGDGALDAVVSEDLDRDGRLDVDEDQNRNRRLDPGEDRDGDRRLDVDEDVNNNGQIDVLDGVDEDINNDGRIDPLVHIYAPGVDVYTTRMSEDINNNGVLDRGEDINNNGVLDPGEDVNNNNYLDPNEDKNNNLALDPAGYISVNGTSFAAPLVTGTAGLLLSLRPELTPEQVKHYIIHNGLDVRTTDPAGRNITIRTLKTGDAVRALLGAIYTEPLPGWSKIAWVADADAGVVWADYVKGRLATSWVLIAPYPSKSPDWSPSGDYLTYHKGTGVHRYEPWVHEDTQIFIVDERGRRHQRLTFGGYKNLNAKWAPNNRLAFVSLRDYHWPPEIEHYWEAIVEQVYSATVNMTNPNNIVLQDVRRLTNRPDGGPFRGSWFAQFPLTWHPSNRWVASSQMRFVPPADTMVEGIRVLPSDGGVGYALIETIGGLGGFEHAPAYSPDGSRIAYIDELGKNLYVANLEDLNGNGILDPGEDLNGNGRIDIATTTLLVDSPVLTPVWSPDGSMIIYSYVEAIIGTDGARRWEFRLRITVVGYPERTWEFTRHVAPQGEPTWGWR